MAVINPFSNLLSPGEAQRRGRKSGQDFIKGIEDIKTAREARRTQKLANDEFEKREDVRDAEAKSKMLDYQVKDIASKAAIEVDKQNPELAKHLVKTEALAKIAEFTSNRRLSENELLYDNLTKTLSLMSEGVISEDQYGEIRNQVNSLLGDDVPDLPENQDVGLIGLNTIHKVLPITMKHQQQLALQNAKIRSEAKTGKGWELGSIDLEDGSGLVNARRNHERVQMKVDGRWVDTDEDFIKTPATTQNKGKVEGDKAYAKYMYSEKRLSGLNANARALANAKRAEVLSKTALSGPGAATLVKIGGATKLFLQAFGLQGLADSIDVSTEEQLQGTSSIALMPFIEAQGRSFSDADRVAFEQTVPSLRTSRETNLAFARAAQISSLNALEKGDFEDQIYRGMVGGEITTSAGANNVFRRYVEDLGRAVVEEGVVTEVVDDKQDLWKHYLNGPPEVWVMSDGQELTWDDIDDIVANTGFRSRREVLADAEARGEIIGTKTSNNWIKLDTQ